MERTAAGSVIWAAIPRAVRLEALLVPAPLTPDPTEIRIADSNIGDAGAARLAARLGGQLRVLELPGNGIGAAGMAALNTALEAGACPQLVDLLGVGKNALSLCDTARDGHDGAVGLLLRGGENTSADERLSVGGEIVEFMVAMFGPQTTRLEAPVLAVATQPLLADAELTNVMELAKTVAVVQRGGCQFHEKARRAHGSCRCRSGLHQ